MKLKVDGYELDNEQAVIGGGNITECEKSIIGKYSNVICCDSGCNNLLDWGVKPTLVIGDMDSVNKEALSFYESSNIPIKRYKRDKDFLDSELAIQNINSSTVSLFGVTGSRADQSYVAYLFLRKYRDKKIFLFSNDFIVVTVKKNIIIEDYAPSLIVSVFAIDNVLFESSKGLKYNLDGLTMQEDSTFGVSNSSISNNIEIKLKTGISIVFLENICG